MNSNIYCQCNDQSFCSDNYHLDPSFYDNPIECCVNDECTLTTNGTYCFIGLNSDGQIIAGSEIGAHAVFDWSQLGSMDHVVPFVRQNQTKVNCTVWDAEYGLSHLSADFCFYSYLKRPGDMTLEAALADNDAFSEGGTLSFAIDITNPGIIEADSSTGIMGCIDWTIGNETMVYCICNSDNCREEPITSPTATEVREVLAWTEVLTMVGSALLLFGLAIIVAVYWHKRYSKLRSWRIKEIASDLYGTSRKPANLTSRNTNSTRLSSDSIVEDGDSWELRREAILIHQENQLGSGHFGRKEIEVMKRIGRHPHVVEMIGCVTLSQPPLLLLHFCSHGNLHHHLIAHRPPPPPPTPTPTPTPTSTPPTPTPIHTDTDGTTLSRRDLLSFAWQISDGMEYLSAKRYVHRDLAARNILLHQQRMIKIGDFGLCRQVKSCEDTYVSRGGRMPLKWMPLEAIRERKFSEKSDVWSFGVLVYEIFSFGMVPYPAIQPCQLEEFLGGGGRLECPEACPAEVWDVTKDCWKEKAEERLNFPQIKKLLTLLLEKMTEQQEKDHNYILLSAP